MKKCIFTISLISAVLLNGILVSCSKNSDLFGGVSGMYAYFFEAEGVKHAHVYNFTNNNTVIIYGTVSNSKRGWSSSSVLEQLPGHSGWYYDSNSIRQYTYVAVDNKITITNGDIFTINYDGSLTPDGSNRVYKKW